MEAAFRRVDTIAFGAGKRWGSEIDRGLAAGKHEVKLDADTAKAEADIDKAARDRETTIEVDVDAAGAEAKLDRLARDRRVELKFDIDSAVAAAAGGGGGGGTVGAVIRDMTVAAGAATAALGLMGTAGVSALSSITSQFGSAAVAASGLEREWESQYATLTALANAWGTTARASTNASRDMDRYSDRLVRLSRELGGFTEAAEETSSSATRLGGSMGSSVVRVAAMGTALAAIVPIAAAAAQALLLVPAALGGIGAGIGTLMIGLHGIGDAFSAVTKANANFGADQTSKASAVAAATRTLTSAVRSEEQAQKDVARARKEAGRELEDLNDKLRDSTLNEAQAQLDLERARERLATGTFETSTDYKQAQLDVLQAEQRVIEAHKANNRTQEEAVTARKKGVEGSDEVVAAKERETAAHENVTAAQKGVDDANAKVSASSTAAAAAMAALSPNAQALVTSLIALKPAWDALSKSVQDALTAGMGTTITQLANTYLPMLQTGMTNLATVFNQMFGAISTELMKPETMAQFQTFLNNVTTAMQNLAPMMGPLVTAFSTLMADGSSFLPGIATAVSNAAIGFSNFVTEASKSGKLKEWMHDGLEVIADLVGMVKALGGAFMALAPLGKFLADRFEWLFKLFESQIKWLSDKFNWLGGDSGPLHFFADKFKWLGGSGGPIEGFKNAFKTVIDFLEDKFRGFYNTVASYLNRLVDIYNRVVPGPDIGHLPAWNASPDNAGGDGTIPVVAANQIPPGSQVAHQGGQPTPPAGPSPAAPPGTSPVVSTPYGDVTVPIVQKPDGTWTSTNPEWAKLIARESAGNPTATQGNIGDANNASGDLALGLFQITTATWVGHGGSQFAPNAKSATPQQQAIIAARIFSARGGKPWGAVPGGGREDEAGLRAGLTTGGGAPVAGSANIPAGTIPVFVTNWPGSSVVGPALPGGAVPAISATGPPNNAAVNAAGAALSAQFPGKKFDLGGSRAPGENASDAGLKRPDHLSGNALDIGIGSDMALGDAVKAWAEANKDALGIDYIMWRVAGHFNHVHLSFKPGFTPSVAGMPGAPGTTPVAAQQPGGSTPTPVPAVPGGATPVPASPSDPTYVNLDPNVPADQRAKAKESGKNGAEQLGKDLVAGIAEAFGFDGTLFKNPAEFGLVKIFAALSKVKPKTGTPNSTTGEPTIVGPGVGSQDGSGDIVNAALGLIPNIPRDDHLNPARQGPGPGNNGTVVNNSVDMSNSTYGYQPGQVGDQIQEGQLRNSRQPLRNLPQP